MTVQLNAAYQAVKDNIPGQFCTPRAQVISLIALGILSSGVAICAANFLVAMPFTLKAGSGLVSLISFIAAGFIYSGDNTKRNITYLESRVTKEELTLILNQQASQMTFVEFFKFHAKIEAFALLTEDNRQIYKKQFIEGFGARQIPTVSNADFINNSQEVLAQGLWLELATANSEESSLPPSVTESLLGIFNLKDLRFEFAPIFQETQGLVRELAEKLQEINQNRVELEKKYTGAKEKCSSGLSKKIERLNAEFEEKPLVKSFRKAEKELERINNSIKDISSRKERLHTELQRLGNLADSREARVAEQEAIIRVGKPKKEARDSVIVTGRYSPFNTMSVGELAERMIGGARNALACIKDEPNKIEKLRQEMSELESQKNQLELEKISTVEEKNKLARMYLFEKGNLDASIKSAEEETGNRIVGLEGALNRKMAELEPEIQRLVEEVRGEFNVKFSELHSRFTAFTAQYNALFS